MKNLFEAAKKNDTNKVKLLLDEGADINVKGGYYKETPLSWAIGRGSVRMVRLMLDEGADFTENEISLAEEEFSKARDENRKIILNILNEEKLKRIKQAEDLFGAVEKGDIDTIKYLLDEGADINMVDGDGDTPLTVASHNGHIEIVQLLRVSSALVQETKDL